MEATTVDIAMRCLNSAYDGTQGFPTIVGVLIAAGFEGYDVDFRRSRANYYLPTGDYLELSLPHQNSSVAERFDPAEIKQAVKDAQCGSPGYTYVGFCDRVKKAGCAGYMVSFLGKRVVYYGRTAETHVEHFPK